MEPEPVVLPNGRLYGIERLRRLNERVSGPENRSGYGGSGGKRGGGGGGGGHGGQGGGRGAAGFPSVGRVVSTSLSFGPSENQAARDATGAGSGNRDIEMAYAAGYDEEDEAGDSPPADPTFGGRLPLPDINNDDNNDDDDDDDDDDDNDDDDEGGAGGGERGGRTRVDEEQDMLAALARGNATAHQHQYDYDSIDGDDDDGGDGMSLDGGVEGEEEGVPGGRGRLRDPMAPREWFEWRDVRKVFIM